MQATTDLSSTQWQVADAIARQMVLDGTDLNEFRKTISYLRAYSDRPDAGKKYFDYLNTLARNGNTIGHSKKTQGYLENITATCQKYLDSYKDDAAILLQILGWAARLMQYYKQAVPIGEIPEPTIQSEREAEIQAVTQTHTFEIGQEIEATVTAIKGNRVTYELFGVIKLTQRKPKRSKDLNLNQVVQVEISELREDGTLKKVKPIS